MDQFRVCPYKKYNQIRDGGGGIETLPLRSTFSGVAAAASAEVVAAVTGKKIRVMGLVLQSDATTTIGSIAFRDGNGGTILFSCGTTALIGGLGPVILPITDSGYFETTVSTALYASGTTQAQLWNVFYITYTPD